MKKDYVYLIGGMEGLTTEHMTGWREKATKNLDSIGIDTLDPTRRGMFHSGYQDTNACNRVFKMDMQDIANSTIVLADMRHSVPGKQWGSAMELMFAHTKNKIIIVWTDEEDPLHPFVESIATEKYHTLDECLDAITFYYK